MYAIHVEKEKLPYKIDIEIAGKLFTLSFDYNVYDNRIYCSLFDVNGNLLAEDEPITYGQIMFSRYYIDNSGNFRNTFPRAVLIPNFSDSTVKEKITFDNADKLHIYVEEF